MRMFLGMLLGVILTVGSAYLHDSQASLSPAPSPSAPAAGTGANAAISLVNWEVVGRKVDQLAQWARAEWTRLAS
jgi:hypothetical protein